MSIRTRPVAVPSPSVHFPDADPSLGAEVVRLRRMVHALAEMLVEHGIVDSSMVEGRLHLATVDADPLDFSAKKPSWWARLWKKQEPPADVGAFPAVMMPVDQTVPVQKMSFEVQSLYDETGGPSVVAPTQGMTTAARTRVGNCTRCWKRSPLSTGQLCARCAVRAG
jgi:hypothetical protein